MRLILASSSPRRREILALLGVPFEIIEPAFDEQVSRDLPVEKEVLDFAVGKAWVVAGLNSNSIVIGSDTMIFVDGKKVGKPAGIADAARMLRSLSGKTHEIYTGVAIIDRCGGPGLKTVERISVDMRAYPQGEIERYLDCNESLDKAGAYSIQGEGRHLIASIRGDYLAAVGLPLKPVANYLKSRGLSSSFDVDKLYAEKSFMNWRAFA
jgi:septum formation protein